MTALQYAFLFRDKAKVGKTRNTITFHSRDVWLQAICEVFYILASIVFWRKLIVGHWPICIAEFPFFLSIQMRQTRLRIPVGRRRIRWLFYQGGWGFELGTIQLTVMAGLQAQSFKLAATLLPLLFEETVLWRLFFRHLQTMTQLTLKQC